MFKLKLFIVLSCIVFVVHAIAPFPNSQRGECGFAPSDDIKIIGGHIARNSEFPWMALLGYGAVKANDFKCGGTVITKRHVLTAAHCTFYNLSYVRLGEHDHQSNTDGRHQDIRVSWIYRHTGYNEHNAQNDIALLWLEKLIQYNDRIRPICLPPIGMTNSQFAQKVVTVAGWGRATPGHPDFLPSSKQLSPILKKLYYMVLPSLICAARYEIDTTEQICAADFVYGHSGCHGDSGGPMMTKEGKNKPFIQIGIVSSGPIMCDSREEPNLYISVMGYMKWIKDAINSFKQHDP